MIYEKSSLRFFLNELFELLIIKYPFKKILIFHLSRRYGEPDAGNLIKF